MQLYNLQIINIKQKQMKRTKLNQTLYIISLITALFVLSQCQIKKQVLPSDPYDNIFQITKADYCEGAPECYMLDENGNEILTFSLRVPDTNWIIHRVTLPNHSEFQNKVMRYAYNKYNDKYFLYLLKAENGDISHLTKHDIPYWREGKKHWDWGFCGISDYYFPNIVNDERFFTDWTWQIDKCWERYKAGTTFYGKARIPQVIHFFKFYDS